MYLGQSGRLRGRLLYDLYRPLYAHTAPWNDPHTAAPALWAYRVEDGYSYEVSVTEAPEDKRERHGLEDYLLWQHRLSTGRSAICNYGRFHSRYVRPSNKKSGRAMSRIAPEADAKLYDESADPLVLRGHPGGAGWMGLTWTRPRPPRTAHPRPPAPRDQQLLRPCAARRSIGAVSRDVGWVISI